MLKKLQLPPLQDHRRHLKLTTPFKIVVGLVPALPPEHVLTPFSKDRRKIKATTYQIYNFDYPIIRQSASNSRGCVISASKTDQFRNSFFVRTVYEWNQLSEETVHAFSADAFTSAVGRTHKF